MSAHGAVTVYNPGPPANSRNFELGTTDLAQTTPSQCLLVASAILCWSVVPVRLWACSLWPYSAQASRYQEYSHCYKDWLLCQFTTFPWECPHSQWISRGHTPEKLHHIPGAGAILSWDLALICFTWMVYIFLLYWWNSTFTMISEECCCMAIYN